MKEFSMFLLKGPAKFVRHAARAENVSWTKRNVLVKEQIDI